MKMIQYGKYLCSYMQTTKFEPLKESEKEIHLQFLSNFFLRGGRIPLYSIENSKMLTKKGAEKYLSGV